MKTKITKKLCSNCKYVDTLMDNYGDAEHLCDLTLLTINNIHEHTCSNHILDTDNFCLSNERESVRKHEQKKNICYNLSCINFKNNECLVCYEYYSNCKDKQI